MRRSPLARMRLAALRRAAIPAGDDAARAFDQRNQRRDIPGVEIRLRSRYRQNPAPAPRTDSSRRHSGSSAPRLRPARKRQAVPARNRRPDRWRRAWRPPATAHSRTCSGDALPAWIRCAAPLTPTKRSPSTGWSRMPSTGLPSCSSAISEPHSCRPVMKARVPSTGSSTQR